MIAAFAIPSPALAQQVDAAPKQGRVTLLQRLILGAGIAKVAVDTPQAVTALEQEDIDRRQPQTFGDILKDVPGVTKTGTERVLGQSFNIRGIGATESAGDQGRIIVQIDGASKFYEGYRMGSLFTDPDLFKRVEVLRGPASSTLYGAGALGGVVSFTTKDASDFLGPDDTVAIRTKIGIDSNRNGYSPQAILAARMGGNAEVLASIAYRTIDDYRSGNGTLIGATAFDAPSGLLKGTFRFGDNNEQVLRASYTHWTSDAKDQQYAQVTNTPAFGTLDRTVTDRTFVLAYENPASANPWLDLDISLSYSSSRNEQKGASNQAPTASRLYWDNDYDYNTIQFNASNTAEFIGDNYENFLAGGIQIAHLNRVVDLVPLAGAGGVNGSGNTGVIGFHPEGSQFKTGAFVQNELIWDDKLTFITGLRIDHQSSETGDRETVQAQVDDIAISPKIAALYKINDTLSVFGSYAYTERLPTIDELFSNDNTLSPALQNSPNYALGLRKERSDNFEAGLALTGDNLIQDGDTAQLKVTAFHNDVRDLIERTPTALRQSVGYNRNIGRIRFQGVEVEAAYDSDYVFANATYSMIRGKDLVPNAANPNGFVNSAAPDELNLTLGGKLPDYGVSFGWRGRFVASQDRARPNVPAASLFSRTATASFNTHDLFASWKQQDPDRVLHGLEVNASVENIFDKQYQEYLSDDPAKGRTFKLGVAYTKTF
ncbi:MAG: TonB-dependent receptor [Sphingopyxis sp.]|nr:TonB-dependent receptor [Sphingopyxis sp.]